MATDKAQQYAFEPATDGEIDDIADLITRAFRAAGWHTEAQLVSDFVMLPKTLRDQLASVHPPATLLQLMDVESGRRLGSVTLRPLDEDLKVWRFGWFAVEPSLQTSGIGRVLLANTERYAQEKGATSMELVAINVRHNLIAWYERRGYKATGKTEPFKHDSDQHGALQQDDLFFITMEKRF
jgi:GNAT superfamily N-acetyltransferase